MVRPAFLNRFERNPPADMSAIKQFESQWGHALPKEYVNFLRESNGGQGFIGTTYIMLWKVEDLWSFNRDYEVNTYAPGLLVIGSNGGGEAFAFDTRKSIWPVVRVPFIGMDLRYADDLAPNFDQFLESLSSS